MNGAIIPQILQPSVQRAFLNVLWDTTNTKTLRTANAWNLNPSAWGSAVSVFFLAILCSFSVLMEKCIDFSNYQLNAQFFYSSTIYMLHYDPQHVSSSTLLILRRTNCITTASGIVTLYKQPYIMQVESGLQSALHLHTVYRG